MSLPLLEAPKVRKKFSTRSLETQADMKIIFKFTIKIKGNGSHV